jgi:hypothetical protein
VTWPYPKLFPAIKANSVAIEKCVEKNNNKEVTNKTVIFKTRTRLIQ